MKKLLLSLILASFAILVTPTANSQTNLSAGDIAFVGFNLDGVDDYAFILLKDIVAGTNIKFTDEGWTDGLGFIANAGDAHWQWTAGTNLTCGTVVTIAVNAPGFTASTVQLAAHHPY